MKYSNYFIPTQRNTPAEAEIPSHRYALRGGYIQKIASGIYDYLPLGLRVLRKIENIVREEMNRAGGIEVLMPSMIPMELWQKSGRWYAYGKELLRIKDRADRQFCYGPTHEEVVVDMVTNRVQSYKQLPITLYQIQTKFRDEIRPRFGLMRAREFTMKDAYSFHDSTSSLDQTYTSMYQTYSNIFKRCGLKFRVVSADSGNIGGNASQEFMITADTGEDGILYCNTCDYAANIEKASTIVLNSKASRKSMEKKHTPGYKSIEEVTSFLKLMPEQAVKALVYAYGTNSGDQENPEEQYALCFIRGDYDVNEIKLGNLLEAQWLQLADDETVKRHIQVPPGFIGPVDLPKGSYRVLYDDSIKGIHNAVIGANETDYHYINANPERDFSISSYTDFKTARAQDSCPECKKGKLLEERGIEVGHIFKLGTKYSKTMTAEYLNEQGQAKPFIMGCYGIGIGRTAMAAIEQSHDDNGPVWPISIAPFEIIIILAAPEDTNQLKSAQTLYGELIKKGIDVLMDDRPERIGVKFKDADLIGSPLRCVFGKKFSEGLVELNSRRGEKRDIPVADALSELLKQRQTLLKAF